MKKIIFIFSIIVVLLILSLVTTFSILKGKSKKTKVLTANQTGNSQYTSAKIKMYLESKKERTINFVILGDGFTAVDINNGIYDREIDKIVSKLTGTPPYQQFINYINVYVVYTISRESGADDAPGKDTHDTIFNSTYGKYGIQRLLVIQDYETAKYYVNQATSDPHSVIILVNDERYGGSGGYYSVASINSSVYWVVMHEMGHSFGGLADEYEDANAAKTYSINGAKYCDNVDVSGDRNSIKWKHLIGLNGYELVGVYEGAYYRSKGVYRPQEYCIMRYLGYPYCHVCRELITKRAFEIIGEQYTLNKFLEHDSVNEKNTANFTDNRINSFNKKVRAYDFDDNDNNNSNDSYVDNNKTDNANKENKNTDVPKNGIYVYEHINYSGYKINLYPGIYNTVKLEQMGIKNDDISSALIPDGFEVIFYENSDFSGEAWIYYTSVEDFTKENHNDKISSIIIKAIE